MVFVNIVIDFTLLRFVIRRADYQFYFVLIFSDLMLGGVVDELVLSC